MLLFSYALIRLTCCAVLSMVSSAGAVTFITIFAERCTNAPVLARLRATRVGWGKKSWTVNRDSPALKIQMFLFYSPKPLFKTALFPESNKTRAIEIKHRLINLPCDQYFVNNLIFRKYKTFVKSLVFRWVGGWFYNLPASQRRQPSAKKKSVRVNLCIFQRCVFDLVCLLPFLPLSVAVRLRLSMPRLLSGGGFIQIAPSVRWLTSPLPWRDWMSAAWMTAERDCFVTPHLQEYTAFHNWILDEMTTVLNAGKRKKTSTCAF